MRRVIHRPDVIVFGVAASVVVLTLLPVRSDGVDGPEATVFEWINGASDVPYVLPWMFMQVGNVGASVVAAAAAWLRRRRALAVALAGGGVATWALAKGVKALVDRGRPGALLEDAVLRHAPVSGGGWISGHAAVTAALLTIAWPALSPRWRAVLLAAVVPMYVARIYVGEHLPLDMLGGAAFGALCGQLVVVGSRRCRPQE